MHTSTNIHRPNNHGTQHVRPAHERSAHPHDAGHDEPHDRVELSDEAHDEQPSAVERKNDEQPSAIERRKHDSQPEIARPVDPKAQDATVADQQARIDAYEEAHPNANIDNVRPSTAADAERYNALVAEAATYPKGSYPRNGVNVTVSEVDGVKSIGYYLPGGGSRTLSVDLKTGSVAESVYKNGFSGVTYVREGDTLGPARDGGFLGYNGVTINGQPVKTLP